MNLPEDRENVLGDLSSRRGAHGRHHSNVLLWFSAIPTPCAGLRARGQVPAAGATGGGKASALQSSGPRGGARGRLPKSHATASLWADGVCGPRGEACTLS